MIVTIQMHGSLRLLTETSTGAIEITLPDEATAASAIMACGVADRAYLLAMDGCVVKASTPLHENCVLDIFPMTEGG